MNEQRKQNSIRNRHGAAIGLFAVAGVLAFSIARLISDGTPATSRAAEPARALSPVIVPVDRAVEIPAELSGGAVAVVVPKVVETESGAKAQPETSNCAAE
jgi:hypothetical protein